MTERPWIWVLVFLAAVVVRLPFLPRWPDTPDGVRFVNALAEFDVHEFSPHFPGYPLAVVLARCMPLDGAAAWAALGTLAMGLTCVVLGLGFSASAVGSAPAWRGALLAAVWPFGVLESLRTGTDAIVLPLLFAGLLGGPRWPLTSGLLLGLALGVRPSAFPWLIGIVALGAACDRARAALGVCLGVGLWLLPTIAVLGPAPYLDDGRHFIAGHFQQWGNTALHATEEGRLATLVRGWGLAPAHLPGAPPWTTGLVLAAGALLALHSLRGANKWLAGSPLGLGALAYSAWIALAQNPMNERHALPLAVLAAHLAGQGLWPAPPTRVPSRFAWRREALFGTVFVLLALSAMHGARALAERPPPALALYQDLARHAAFDPLLDRIYVGGDAAFARHVGPDWDIQPVQGVRAITADLRGTPVRPRRAWVSSLALTPVDRPPGSCLLAASRPPWLGRWGCEVQILAWSLGEVTDAD